MGDVCTSVCGVALPSLFTPLVLVLVPPPLLQVRQRRETLLLRYVREVEPKVMEDFHEHTPPEVIDAMRTTITNLLGSLPPQYFRVTVNTVGEHLAHLMYSFLMTGYMFRSAQFRLELKQLPNVEQLKGLPPQRSPISGFREPQVGDLQSSFVQQSAQIQA